MSETELRALVSRLMRGLNHDLKNPLGAADGYVDLLLQGFRGDITAEQRQTLERIRVLLASGVSILEDVVAFARASIGELRVHASHTDVKAAVRMELEHHHTRAAEAGISIDFQAPDEPVRLSMDATLVSRIVAALLDNAIDHAPDDSRVEVRVRQDGAGAEIRVGDEGAGVPEADRERIFEAFERGGQPARSRRSAGIGIGLALARALAEMLGGTLELVDGSTFVVKLEPVAARQDDDVSPA